MTTRAHAFALDVIANAESGVGTQFAGTDVLELARAYVGVGEVLVLAQQALNDWTCIHADDMVGEKAAAEAKARVCEFGTLAYIADVQRQISEILYPPPSEGRDG